MPAGPGVMDNLPSDDERVVFPVPIPVRGRFFEATGVPQELDSVVEVGRAIGSGRSAERLRVRDGHGPQEAASRRTNRDDGEIDRSEQSEGEVPESIETRLAELVSAEPQED